MTLSEARKAVDDGTTWSDETGRTTFRIRSFEFVVENYDAEEYVVFQRDSTAMPIYVRDVQVPRGITPRYTHWENVCDRAYKAAIQQAMA